MGAFLAIIAIFALIFIGSIWRGFVLTKLWAWFIVPTFGLPALAIVPAIGISLVIGFLVYQHHYVKDDRDTSEKYVESFSMMFIYPAIVLLSGWIITLFL